MECYTSKEKSIHCVYMKIPQIHNFSNKVPCFLYKTNLRVEIQGVKTIPPIIQHKPRSQYRYMYVQYNQRLLLCDESLPHTRIMN